MIIFQSFRKNLFRIIFIDFFKKKWRSEHNMQNGKEMYTFYKYFAKKFVCLLILLSCTHILFFFRSHGLFANNFLKYILLALAVDMHFDMAALSIINVQIIIFCVLSQNLKPTNFRFAVFCGQLFSNTRRKGRCKIFLLHIEKDEH